MTTATISRMLLHTCPRCHGDMLLNEDDAEYGCLQCGRTLTARKALGMIHNDLPARTTSAGSMLRLLQPMIEETEDDAA